jgi:hypothetical protein
MCKFSAKYALKESKKHQKNELCLVMAVIGQATKKGLTFALYFNNISEDTLKILRRKGFIVEQDPPYYKIDWDNA